MSTETTESSGLPPRTMAGALAALGTAKKPGAGVPAYTRWINRWLARFMAAAAYSWGWSPNMVTAVSACFSVVAIALVALAPATVGFGLLAAVLFAFGYLLDSADGQVARLGKRGSLAGEWLDHVVDSIRTPAIHLAVLIGLWRQGGDRWVWLVAILYCALNTGQFMSQILAEQLARSRAGQESPEVGGVRQSLLLLPTDSGVLCWVFVLWGLPTTFAIAYTVLFLANLVHTAASMRRKYQKLVRLQSVPRA